MRSATPPDLTGLCATCWQREPLCLCAEIPRVRTRTEIVVLRHVKETWRTSNTSRIASIALERTEVIEVGGLDDDRMLFESRVAEVLARPGESFLLYPGTGNAELPRDRPIRLIVPDGSWRQARRMLLRVPGLSKLPRITFAAPAPAARLRTPPTAEGLSTIEAIALALGSVEGDEVSRPLIELYRKMVDRSLPSRRRSALGENARRR
jgi:DTW domain-containing protein YfiP